MSETEFELIDALYFTLSFNQLQKELKWDSGKLKTELLSLIRKGWVKALHVGTEEEQENYEELDKNYLNYLYLATKDGLMAHNSR